MLKVNFLIMTFINSSFMTIAKFFRMVLNVYTHAHGHAYILIHKYVHTPKQTSKSSLMTHILSFLST